MSTHVEKKQPNLINKGTFRSEGNNKGMYSSFVDQRPQTAIQAQLQLMANNNSVVQKLEALQGLADRKQEFISLKSQHLQPVSNLASSDSPSQLSKKENQEVVQRAIVDFRAQTENLVPPGQNLIDELEYASIDEQYDGEIEDQVKERISSKGVKTIPAPYKIEAEINNNQPVPPARNAYYSGAVGKIGRDQFFFKTGTTEVFEGGHIIPHSLWDKNDSDVANADHYNNLVPMSRTLNVENWATRENWMRDKINNLDDNASLILTVDITRDDWVNLKLGDVARFFNLTMAAGANSNEKIEIYNWLPSKLKLNYERRNPEMDESSEGDFTSDQEELQDTFTLISTKDELISALMNSQFAYRISNDLWNQLNANLV